MDGGSGASDGSARDGYDGLLELEEDVDDRDDSGFNSSSSSTGGDGDGGSSSSSLNIGINVNVQVGDKTMSGGMIVLIVLCILVVITGPLVVAYCIALRARWNRQKAYNLSGTAAHFSNPLAYNSAGDARGTLQQNVSSHAHAPATNSNSFSNPVYGVHEKATKAASQVYNFNGAEDYVPQSHA